MTKLNKRVFLLLFNTFIIFCIYLFPGSVISQNVVIDSLENELQNNPQSNKYKLKQYYQLAKQYQDIDVIQSQRVAFNLLNISKDHDSLVWSLYALDLIVLNYEALNEFDSCIKYSREAINIAKTINKPWDVAYFQSTLGNAQGC